MKITDRMRLDWLVREALAYADYDTEVHFLGFGDFVLEAKHGSLRAICQAIDAAIRGAAKEDRA